MTVIYLSERRQRRRALLPRAPEKPPSPARRIGWFTAAVATTASAYGYGTAACLLFLCAAATPWLLRNCRQCAP